LPEDVALIIETGCWQCDGPTESLVRMRRLPDGTVEETPLFTQANTGDGVITGYAVSADGAQVAVAVCRPAPCGDLGQPAPDVQTYISWSRDGGISYVVGPPYLEGMFGVAGFTDDQLLLSGPYGIGSEPTPYLLFRSMVPPITAAPPGAAAYALPREILWSSTDHHQLRDASGTLLFETPQEVLDVVPLDANGDPLAVVTYPGVSTSPSPPYNVQVVFRDEAALRPLRQFTHEGYVELGGAIGETTLAGNFSVDRDDVTGVPATPEFFAGFLPGLLDTAAATIHPLTDPFLRPPYLNGRSRIAGVQRGPVLKVSPEVGSCLRLREQPDGSSADLDCIVGEGLVRDLGESRPGGTQTWRRVATLTGMEGWMSEEFLVP
jgi:hypothetical protein